MLGFGVLLNVLNRFSNAGFGKAHVMCCQVLFPIILNPCVFQGKFYPHVSDLFTPNSSKCHLEKAAIGGLSTPVAFFLSFSSCNQFFHLASTKQVRFCLGKLADEGTSLSPEFSSVFWRLFLYPTSPSSSSISFFFPKLYFFVSLI